MWSSMPSAQAVSVEVTGISDPFTAGASSDVTVTARDAGGSVATGYVGTVAFSKGGAGAGVSVNYPFTLLSPTKPPAVCSRMISPSKRTLVVDSAPKTCRGKEASNIPIG